MIFHHVLRCPVAVIVIGAVLSGCGARLTDAQVVAAQGTPIGPAAPSQGSGPVTTTAGARGAAPVGGQPGSGDAGVTASPAGGADVVVDDAAPAGTGACAPAATDAVGVTDSTITLGEVATLSGPIPGLGQTGVNGVKAYIAYRNSTGGVCGRTLELDVADDRLDAGQNRAETARLANEAFALVGGWSAVDDGGANALEGTDVPDVGLAISDRRFLLPNNFSSNPITQGESGALPIITHMRDTYQPRSAAVVWAASSAPRLRAEGYIRDIERLGIPVVVQREVAIAETNYVPVAQEIENQQVDLVITAMEITGISRMAQALQQVDYLPRVPFYGAQTYGPAFLELAGSAAEGTIIGITHAMVEDAPANPAVQTFVEWYRRVNPGAPIDYFSFQGWVAADMLADAIAAAGPAPTRQAVLDALRAQPTFDADGLAAPFDAANKRNTQCFAIVTVSGGQWRRVFPDSGFACP